MERFLLKLYLIWKKIVARRERERIVRQGAENVRLRQTVRRLASAMEEIAAEAQKTLRVDAAEVRAAARLAQDETYVGESFLYPANFRPPSSLFRRPRRRFSGLPACGAGQI